MTRPRDPDAMAPADRLGEVGGILALAYRRLQLSRQKALESYPDPEPSCEPVNHSRDEAATEGA